MKESKFIAENEADWRQLEELLIKPRKDADKLLHLFEKVSGDLAYARTYYPNRSIRVYLNNLTQSVLNTLVKKRKRFDVSDLMHFYKVVLPAEIYRSRKAFYVSFFVFTAAVLIGVVSSANVDDFANVVLGDSYVSMTEENINKGDPMAVYKDMEQGSMFMAITINNIKVSFLCFMMGLLGSLGTIIILLSNGIMLGTFQYYFFKKGLFLTSFLTIWIHGTIEISSIILAGAAGLMLGNGLMFPRSYSRNASLLLSAKRALRIILAIMPLFIIAGFLESFVTRLTGMPTMLKVIIILVSLLLILGVFVIYPIYCARNGLLDTGQLHLDPVKVENLDIDKYSYTSINSTLAITFAKIREVMGGFLSQMLLPAFLSMCLVSYLVLKFKVMAEVGLPIGLDFADFEARAWPFGVWLVVLTTFLFVWLMIKEQGRVVTGLEFLKALKEYFFKVLPLAIIFTVGYYYSSNFYLWAIFLIVPLHFIFILMEEMTMRNKLTFTLIKDKFYFSFRYWFDFFPIIIAAIICVKLLNWATNNQVFGIVVDFIGWHNIFDNSFADSIYVNNLIGFLIYFCTIPFVYYAYVYRYGSVLSLVKGVDLTEKLSEFGTVKKSYHLQR